MAFIALQEQLLWPLLEIFETRIEFAKGRALLARVFSYLDTPATVVEASSPTTLARQDFQQGIRFENVGFAYGDRVVLKDLTFEIPAGKHTALVGPTGSGKTTISYLLARLYDADQGCIRYDGIDSRELSFATLASLVGIVTQDTFLLNASIEANLRFAKPDASEAELWWRWKGRSWMPRCADFPRGWRPVSVIGVINCPVASASVCPWRVCYCVIHRSFSWMKRPAPWTAAPRQRWPRPWPRWRGRGP